MIVDQIPPPSYHIIAVIYKDGIKVSNHKYNPDEKFLECSKFNIKVVGNALDLLVVYRQLARSVIKFLNNWHQS